MFKKIMFAAIFSVLAAAVVIPSSTSFAVGDMTGWKKAVVKAVAKKQKYPRSAIAREIEGKAKVRLVVAADGSITSHEVVEPTGEAVLDKEIPKLVKRLNPFPALPSGQGISFTLPLSWSLD